MRIPQYWAEARRRTRVNGRQRTIRRFGWSDSGETDARDHAEQRLQEAIDQAQSGGRILNREPKRPYNGAEGVPIREEIVSCHGDTVITRNSYGALCLNTPDVLFADMDFEHAAGVRLVVTVYILLLLAAAALGYMHSSWQTFFIAGIAALVSGVLVAHLLFRVFMLLAGGAERRARRRVRRFSRRHPDWNLRLYRTPAGYRVLVMHRRFDPNGSDALGFLKKLRSDPLYVRMCRNQQCFRARISPKPWRIGINTHMKPRPGVWPVNPDRLPARQLWIDQYERSTSGYASCRFVESFGSDSVDPGAETVRGIHDRYCRAESGLEIA